MNAETIECANDACQCFVTAPLDPALGEPSEAYCGGSCRAAATNEESNVCACGHPQCDAS